MATLTIASLPRITAVQLRNLITTPTSVASLAIVDVRDSDYIGGHIAKSINVPSSTHDVALPELVRKLSDKKVVVFHCMLSQMRGPSAALRYARERERMLRKKATLEVVHNDTGDVAPTDQELAEGEQLVMILTGGFEGWVQSGYGDDAILTEGFSRELWEGE